MFAGAEAQQDVQAKEILSKVSQTMKSKPSVDAKFTFEMSNKKQNIQEKSTGTIVLKDKKYKLNIPQMGLQVTSDGTTIWTYMVNSNEVSISNLADATDDLMDPSRIFTIYERGYNYKFSGESVDSGIAVYNVDLTPQKASSEAKSIKLLIDKQKMLIYKANIEGKDGNNYQLTIKEYKTDVVYKDTEFTFDPGKIKGIEVIDMR
jgi:outer membrane lipoprotein-sorting protein